MHLSFIALVEIFMIFLNPLIDICFASPTPLDYKFHEGKYLLFLT